MADPVLKSGTKNIDLGSTFTRLEETQHERELAAGLMSPEEHAQMHAAQTTDKANEGG